MPHPGKVVAQLLKERRLRQLDVAREAGISPSFLSDVVHGRRRPSLRVLAALARVLGVSPASIFEQVYGTDGPSLQHPTPAAPEDDATTDRKAG